MCLSIPRINFRYRYISFSGHLVDAAMKARSRWCFLPPSVSVDCQYLGKTARDGGIEQAGFLVPIRVSAHLLTRFDDRNLSRYKTADWEKRCAARESRIYREVLITSRVRRSLWRRVRQIVDGGLAIFSLRFSWFFVVFNRESRSIKRQRFTFHQWLLQERYSICRDLWQIERVRDYTSIMGSSPQ